MAILRFLNSGESRLQRPDIVRRVNDLACRMLYNLQSSRPEFKSHPSASSSDARRRRYAELLLRLRALHGVDSDAFRRLFGVDALLPPSE